MKDSSGSDMKKKVAIDSMNSALSPAACENSLGACPQWNSGTKKSTLLKQMADAFREGVQSGKGSDSSRVKSDAAPKEQIAIERCNEAETLDRRKRKSGTTVSGIVDIAKKSMNTAGEMVNDIPHVSKKMLEAFREGVVSVKHDAIEMQERKTKKQSDNAPQDYSESVPVINGVLKAGAAVTGIIRDAVEKFKPGAEKTAERQIRMCEKEIVRSYVDIGREAVDAWSRGEPVESDKIKGLISELRNNEDAIRELRLHIADVAAAGKKGHEDGLGNKSDVISPGRNSDGIDAGDAKSAVRSSHEESAEKYSLQELSSNAAHKNA